MLDSFFLQSFTIISLLFISIISLVVLKRGFEKKINRIFFLLALILNIWLFGSFMLFSGQESQRLILWDRFIYIGIVFWPALQYNFALAITSYNKKRHLCLYFAYALSLVFLLFIPSNYFISDFFYYSWGSHGQAQVFHYLFLIYFVVFAALFFKILIEKYNQEKREITKNRLLFNILAFVIINIVAILGFLPAYSIAIFPIYFLAPILFVALIAYSVAYYKLINTRFIMRRYFVYFLSFSSIVIPANLIVYLVDSNYYYYTFVTSIVIYSVAIFIFPAIKKFFYSFSNKYFFSSLYDENDLIYKLSLSLHSSFEAKKVFKSSIDLISEAFHSKSAAILNYNINQEKIIINYKKALPKMRDKKIQLNQKNFRIFFSDNKAIKLKNIKNKLTNSSCPMFDYLEKNQIKVIIPIETKSETDYYFMVFGQKESKEKYLKRDLKVLELSSLELGLALNNIFLYQDVKKFNIKLNKEIKKATEKLRKQNLELKKLDKMKDEFISIVSHELRSPLTAIRWSTEILAKNKNKNLNKRQINLLNQIKTNNLNLIKLVNDLLDLSRIELDRKFTIKKERFKFSTLVKEVIEDNLFLINKKNLKIKNQVSNLLSVNADRDKIKQVLQNLLINAIKYSHENKAIKIYSEVIKNKMYFYIKDSGIGIPKDQQKYLFTKFFRAKNAYLQNTSGSGLGLYIAKEIIKHHKGEIFYKDNKKNGSIFYFSLPLK